MESIGKPAGEEEGMCHEARRRELERKLLSHAPQVGWGVHRAGHVLSMTLDTSP